MKHSFLIILFCVIFGNILSSKYSKKRISSQFNFLKLKKNFKEKLRKLDISDSDGETDIGSTEYILEDSDANVTLNKFYNFTQNGKNIAFNGFFYFFKSDIANIIKLYLKVIYNSRIRILQSESESVSSTCNIKDAYKSLSAKDGGVNVGYKCEATLEKDTSVKNVSLDKSKDLELDGKKLSFAKVKFDGDAYNEASNLNIIKNYSVLGVLDNSKATFEENSFKIVGKATYDELVKTINGKSITMEFIDYLNSGGKAKNYTCKGENNSALVCDGTINTYIGNLTQAKSVNDDVYLKINIPGNANASEYVGTPTTSSNNNPISKTSSGGLSGGAIAGIVIAGVVVLGGVTVTSILLSRGSKPPLDQTSNVAISSTKIV